MKTKDISTKENPSGDRQIRREGSFEKHMDTLKLLAGVAGYLGQGIPRAEHNGQGFTFSRAA